MAALIGIGHGSIAEQLQPLSTRIRQSRPSIVPVSQMSILLQSEDCEQVFCNSRQLILRWIADRAGRDLPNLAWNGDSFDLEEIGAQRVAAVALEGPTYWAARLDDSDKHIPQRVWTTEVGLGKTPEGGVLVGTRLTCVTRGASPPFDRSLPGFVRRLIETGLASLDGRHLTLEPWLVRSDADVDQLLTLMRSRQRRADIIVFSLPDGSEDAAKTVANAPLINQRTLGAAHVAILCSPASFALSARVGKEFSVFRQAVRTYRPGFDSARDQPFTHPLAMPDRIISWRDGGAESFERFLIEQTLARSVLESDMEERVPSFTTVRQIGARLRREAASASGTDDKDLLVLALEENSALSSDLAEQKEEYDGLLIAAEREASDARQAREEMAAIVHGLRARVEMLDHRVKELAGRDPEIPIPMNLEGLEIWGRENLAGSIVLHNRALQGAKKSEYNDPSLVYKALLLLRDRYVAMRRFGGDEFKQAYDDALAELGLEESATFAAANYEGDRYEVQYGGRPRLLDRHLKHGNSHEPRLCFRLYFFWDEDTEQVVVGWLPSHLQNRMT
jgi:hypothetical protein